MITLINNKKKEVFSMEKIIKVFLITFLAVLSSLAFAQAHKNEPSDTKCVWCDEAEYGKCEKSISKPKRHEHKTEDTTCRWCGSEKYGLGCKFCPYRSKVHEHGPIVSQQTKTMIGMRLPPCVYHKALAQGTCSCTVAKCKWCGDIYRNYYIYMENYERRMIPIKWEFCPSNPIKPEKRTRHNPLCKGLHEE